ncbi:MAG: SLC13 family permease, partial [Halobacteriaceae archaeon]
GVPAAEGISGFANPATVTVLAMFVLSAGVRRTGVVQRLGRWLGAYTGDSEFRQLAATTGIVGPLSGFINNTAAVAVLLPMVVDLAEEGGTSPSKLLLPLSYASMFGGMLTLIGTSTNILASEVAADLGVPGTPFSMFEFTLLGAALTVVGTAYLLVVAPRLLAERVPPTEDLTEEFGMADYLTEIVVREDTPFVGQTVAETLAATDIDLDIVQLVRGERSFLEPLGGRVVRAGDVFVVRVGRDELVDLLELEGVDLVPEEVTERELERAEAGENLVEVVVGPGSPVAGESLVGSRFRERYDATVLALRRGGEVIHRRMDNVALRVGDALLVEATTDAVARLDRDPGFIVAQELAVTDYRTERTPVAVGIVAGVVGLAAVGALPIVVSALAGAVAMVVTGCLRPTEVYESVQWDVIVLLAGVIPLGLAMQETGAARLLADALLAATATLPPVAVLGAFYLLTVLLTNVVSNNATVVMMIPVAVATAVQTGASAFSFVLAVTFAASTAFMTPVGYQTNLFVYGPGGYRFSDYLLVGTPLQLVFAVVTTAGIALIWGV